MKHNEEGSIVCDLKRKCLLHFKAKAQELQNFLSCMPDEEVYITDRLSTQDLPGPLVITL